MSTREPDIAARTWSAFKDALRGPIADWPPALWGTMAVVAVLAGLMGTSPTLFLDDMALDAFIPLDGALRMTSGQWPHADFYTPIGALYYVLLGAAAALTGGAATTVIWAQVLFVPPVFLLSWIATRDRLPTPHRVGLVLFACAATVSPRTLDSEGLISHLAAYNRLGWVLSGIVFMAIAIEPVRTDRRREAVEALALLACTVLAFYLKVTFFALCGAALLVGLLSRPPNWRAPLAAGIGSLALLAAGFALLDTNALYLEDLRRAAASSADRGLLRMGRFQSIFAYNRMLLVGIFLGLLWLIRTSVDPEAEAEASRWTIKLGALVAASVLVTSQSHDAAIPVLTVVAVACFAALLRREDSPSLAVVGLLAFGAVAWPVALDVQAIGKHAIMSRSSATVPLVNLPHSPAFGIRVPAPEARASIAQQVLDGTVPARLYDGLSDAAWNRDDDIILRDATALLQAHGQSEVRIASLTFSPSFPWMLKTVPPRGLPSWYDYRRTFSAITARDQTALLNEVDAILVPKVWQIEGLWDAHAETIEAHFTLAGETPLWRLWIR